MSMRVVVEEVEDDVLEVLVVVTGVVVVEVLKLVEVDEVLVE